MKKYKLPWPPSANHYWFLVACKGGGRKVIGKKGKQYRQDVKDILGDVTPLKTRLKVSIYAYPPDRRKRDLDNMLKASLDALEEANAFEDDNQIDELHVYRREVIKGGSMTISIEEIKNG